MQLGDDTLHPRPRGLPTQGRWGRPRQGRLCRPQSLQSRARFALRLRWGGGARGVSSVEGGGGRGTGSGEGAGMPTPLSGGADRA